MKDPAVLFYTSDFLTGCTTLTMEERGQYITLLCLQHQIGVLSEKTIRLSVGNVSVDVLEKFKKDENGNFYNERMNIEIEKRSNFVDTRRSNGSKGGRPKLEENKPNGLPNAKPKGKPKKNLIEDENRNVNKDIIKIEFDVLDNYTSILEKWFIYKLERSEKYKSNLSKEQFYKNLLKLSKSNFETAEKIINQSIGNNWAGIFELKNDSKPITEPIKPKSKNMPLHIEMLYVKKSLTDWDKKMIKEYEDSL
jgi:hypothetical protein